MEAWITVLRTLLARVRAVWSLLIEGVVSKTRRKLMRRRKVPVLVVPFSNWSANDSLKGLGRLGTREVAGRTAKV
jgi:hypothetical protein